MKLGSFSKIMGCIVVIGLMDSAVCASTAPKKSDMDSADFKQMMSRVPTISHGGSWPPNSGYVRYDSLHRKGKLLFGRYADNLEDACSGTTAFTSMPDESNWQTPIQGFNCKNGDLVLFAQLKGVKAEGAISDVRLAPGGGACSGFAQNVDVINLNRTRRVRATIGYHKNGYPITTVVPLSPGGRADSVLYCDYGDAWVAGACYIGDSGC